MNRNTADRPEVVAIFDLDCTITSKDTYPAFLLSVLRKRPGCWVRATTLPLPLGLHVLGLRSNSWLKETFLRAIAGGATREQVDRWVKAFLSQFLQSSIRPGARRAIREHKKSGHRLIIATASFDFYVGEIGRRLGFDEVISTRAQWDRDGRLSGTIAGVNCHGPAKLDLLTRHLSQQASLSHTVAYSDHHSDLPLLRWVDRPVAVNPTKRLTSEATSLAIEIQDWR